MVRRINESWERGIHFAALYVETNGVQDVIKDAIREQAGADGYEWQDLVLPFTTGNNKWDSDLGVAALDVDFEQGTVVWPFAESTRTEWAHHAVWSAFETDVASLTTRGRPVASSRPICSWRIGSPACACVDSERRRMRRQRGATGGRFRRRSDINY